MANPTEVPCTACGWSAERQKACCYNSHVKLFYGVHNRGVWSIGSNLILKERINAPPNNETLNSRFLRTHTTIPVPDIIEEWSEDDGSHFILMKRIHGVTLNEAWLELSESDKHRIAKQVAQYLDQLRKLHSSTMGSIDGKPFYSAFLFRSTPNTPHGPMNSDDELWQEMAKGLEKTGLSSEICRRLGSRMPTAGPHTFTHCDLTDINIIVKDRNLAGIIDWEYGSYFPVWWEFVSTKICNGPEDKEWKDILRQYMEKHTAAEKFWVDYYKLSSYPNLDEYGEKVLRDLELDDVR